MPPHVYALADNAYNRMTADGVNQSVIVSGESGAGKSESMKLVLQYLAEKSGATIRKKKEGEKATKEEASLQEQILQSNPVMEAFGNAKTVRNNNSSRFGKWIEVKFNGTGQISNGHIISE